MQRSADNVMYYKDSCAEFYQSVGCYKDDSDRAMATLEGKNEILDTPYLNRENAIEKCFHAAQVLGFRFFAVQDRGWCAAGNSEAGYQKYGPADQCIDGKGGPGANDVYRILSAVVPTVIPSTAPDIISPAQREMDKYCENLGVDDAVPVETEHEHCNDNRYARFDTEWRCYTNVKKERTPSCASNRYGEYAICSKGDRSSAYCTRNETLKKVWLSAATPPSSTVSTSTNETSPKAPKYVISIDGDCDSKCKETGQICDLHSIIAASESVATCKRILEEKLG